jgi:DNA-binding PadR family transcriptional regulator
MAEHPEEASAKLEQELRRGILVLATLSQLREPQYGYSLRQALAANGMSIEEGTLYPLLRRLEGQGLLASEWRIEDGPPRRYYTLSEEGKKLYAGLTVSWRSLVDTVDRLISPTAAGDEQSRKRKAAP